MPSQKISQMDPLPAVTSGTELPCIDPVDLTKNYRVLASDLKPPIVAAGAVVSDGANIIADPVITNDLAGSLANVVNFFVNFVIAARISCADVVSGSVVFDNGGILVGSSNALLDPSGNMHLNSLIVDTLLTLGAGVISLDPGTGEIVAPTLRSTGAFTGTGAYTNFTIVDGIIIAAS